VALPGALTVLAAGNINQDDGRPRVAAAVSGPDGAFVLVFENDRDRFAAPPARDALPAAAQALAVGRLDDDRLGDLAILAGGKLLVLHGRPPQGDAFPGDDPRAGTLETLELPFAVRAFAPGEFIWDRDSRAELALLGDDGLVRIAAQGELDTRPWTADEMREKRKRLERIRAGLESAAAPVTPVPMKWKIVETVAAAGRIATGSAATLQAVRMSSLPADDLLVIDPGADRIAVIHDSPFSGSRRASFRAEPRQAVELASGGAVAALPMRVGVEVRPGLVTLAAGNPAPQIFPLLPAATFTVTKTTDTNDGACNADCSLREAIVAANAAGGADAISLPAGTYTLTIAGSDNAAAQGDLDINDSVTITGAGAASSIISTSYTAACGDCKVFGVNQDGTHLSLAVGFSGVTIQNGYNAFNASCGGTFQETGGGIDFYLTGTGNAYSVTNSTLNNNKATSLTDCAGRHGGGINVDSTGSAVVNGPSAGTVTLNGVTVSNNSADYDGGGISLFSDLHNVNLTNCNFTGNTSARVNGGGLQIRHSYGGTVTVNGGNYTNNTAQGAGGGISASLYQNVSISGITVTGNSSLGGGPSSALSLGGGLLLAVSPLTGFTPTATVGNSTFSTNHADGSSGGSGWGGGIYSANGVPPTLTNLTISGNTARKGAGIFEGSGGAGSATTLNGGTISNNSASISGGGAAAANGVAAALNLNNVTLTGNSAVTSGGGLLVETGALTTSGVRLFGNTAPSGSGIAQSGGTATVTNTWWGCDGAPNAAGCQTGAGVFNANPRLDLRLLTSLATINVNQTSTLTANFNLNSAGGAVTPTALNGLTVTFGSDALGSVGPATNLIASGTASSTFTAGSTGGISTVSATLDNGTQTATITINEPAAVVTSPVSATRCTGSSVSFSATGRGYPAPTMQWQQSTDGGGTWPPVGGATSSPYSFTTALSQNGYRYRAVFTNPTGTATTAGATLTVVDFPLTVGTTFRIGKSGGNAVYTWTDIAGASDYGVYGDAAANGTFAIQAGQTPSGNPGLMLPLAGASAFYKVAGRNICGVGAKD
jgi:CSLREA domain-containing protein